MRRLATTILLAAALPGAVEAKTGGYAMALASSARPAADRARDAARKPTAVLAFMQVKPGQKVGDFVTGGGYCSRILAGAVGPKGMVYAFQPTEFTQFAAAYAAVPTKLEAEQRNIKGVVAPFAAPVFPEPLDAVVTVQNFHDLYLKPFPTDTAAKAAAALYRALKPGGILTIVDHSAVAGSDLSVADKVHRITPEAVIAELTKAGFKLEARDLATFANAADPRTTNVFDSGIRGKTDQFMLRFRKPR